MSTVIRPEISEKNEFYITKERYYELKHFCLQYKEWKKFYSRLENCPMHSKSISKNCPGGNFENHLEKIAIGMARYSTNMKMIENLCKEIDPVLGDYIFKAVTEGLSYAVLNARLEIPCCRDTFYQLYREFFSKLDEIRS